MSPSPPPNPASRRTTSHGLEVANDRARPNPTSGSTMPTRRQVRVGRWRTRDDERRPTANRPTRTRARAGRGDRYRSRWDCSTQRCHRSTPTTRRRPGTCPRGSRWPERETPPRARPVARRTRFRRCRPSAASPRVDTPRSDSDGRRSPAPQVGLGSRASDREPETVWSWSQWEASSSTSMTPWSSTEESSQSWKTMIVGRSRSPSRPSPPSPPSVPTPTA
jgi:hypothetical protein